VAPRCGVAIIVIDGTIGFTGGLNIGSRYWKPEDAKAAFHDLHFRLLGPVMAHLVEVFADDWQFTTGEEIARRSRATFRPVSLRKPKATGGTGRVAAEK
jgi:phosphatidylserine/phosphatidylglycerophosphate/cardiolipin synthase-like enzyme